MIPLTRRKPSADKVSPMPLPHYQWMQKMKPNRMSSCHWPENSLPLPRCWIDPSPPPLHSSRPGPGAEEAAAPSGTWHHNYIGRGAACRLSEDTRAAPWLQTCSEAQRATRTGMDVEHSFWHCLKVGLPHPCRVSTGGQGCGMLKILLASLHNLCQRQISDRLQCEFSNWSKKFDLFFGFGFAQLAHFRGSVPAICRYFR